MQGMDVNTFFNVYISVSFIMKDNPGCTAC